MATSEPNYELLAEGEYDYIIEADILRRQPLWHLYTNDPIEEVKNEILRDSG